MPPGKRGVNRIRTRRSSPRRWGFIETLATYRIKRMPRAPILCFQSSTKTHVYQLAVERLELTAQEISFQSANAWDVAGAASFGLWVAWINRFNQHAERLGYAPDAELTSLAELPGLVAGETPNAD